MPPPTPRPPAALPAAPSASRSAARTTAANTTAANPGPAPDVPAWQPTTARHRLALLLLTVATVLGLAYVLQRPHQRLVAAKAAQHQAACRSDTASRPADCPGARMPVLLLPPQPATAQPAASVAR